MQASLLVCLLAASVFGEKCRSSAERAPYLALFTGQGAGLVDIAKGGGEVASVKSGESTSFGFGVLNGCFGELIQTHCRGLKSIKPSIESEWPTWIDSDARVSSYRWMLWVRHCVFGCSIGAVEVCRC